MINNKVLVTGADGFIGSHLTEMLLEKGYRVKALAYYNSFNDWGWLEGIHHPRLEVVTGDIRDPHLCKHITKILTLSSILQRLLLFLIPTLHRTVTWIPISGTLNICQAAKENSVGRVIVTSTSEVYGTAQYVPIDEKHPKQPQSPYSATKIGANAIAMSFSMPSNFRSLLPDRLIPMVPDNRQEPSSLLLLHK